MDEFVQVRGDNPEQFSKIIDELSVIDRGYNAEERLYYVVPKIIRKFAETIFSIGSHLVKPGYLVYRGGYESVMGAKMTIVDSRHVVTRIERHGLSMSDLQEYISPGLTEIYYETLDAELDIDQALRKIGQVVGVAAANSQMMGDTNTRTARILQDYISDGIEGVTPERAFDDTRNYLPSREIEDCILEQNIVRLRDGIVIGRYEPRMAGAVYVDDITRERLAMYQGIRNSLEMTDGFSSLNGKLRAALAQRIYGAATLLVHADTTGKGLDIQDVIKASSEITQIDTWLLSMRVISHMAAYSLGASDPEIVTIENTEREDIARVITRRTWEPFVRAIDKP